MDPESERLREAQQGRAAWKRWGPYLSERQWGTVREDYSESGDAWNHFSHDQSRSRAYRWGEDGLAGWSDDRQRLCFALALWNGADPILKERLFGLTNSEGNHGEDVKEYYFYLDATPTHSSMRWLYKYPQRAFPYEDLVTANAARGREEPEYELLDTGIFDDDRYFDVFVEYAKESPETTCIEIRVCNRGPEAASLHVLPTLWFRNTWSWQGGDPRPSLSAEKAPAGTSAILARHGELGDRWLVCDGAPELLFTENESNEARLFGAPNRWPFVKDAFHEAVVHRRADAVNPALAGTKSAAHVRLEVPAGGEKTIRLRLTDVDPSGAGWPRDAFGADFDAVLAARRGEADAFYAEVLPESLDDDARLVARQALAGMLWSKQYYGFDLDQWLDEHGASPLAPRSREGVRNRDWSHMVNDDVISMPDKWEYPWYAAWDLAFHAAALVIVDPELAKHQLDLMLRDLYLHPNGQMPAYEWNFGDVNPPVHAWATLYVYDQDKRRRGKGDLVFLERSFQKLLLNFTWWLNRKDPTGRNVFQGGFLGLDNIGVFDRSAPLPTGGSLEQADGTAWMAFYAQSMFAIALELASHDPIHEELALRFLEHFLRIAAAMDRIGLHDDELWDEEDGFFYDLLRFPDGHAVRLKVRSMVGLLPLAACTVIAPDVVARFPRLVDRARRFIDRHPELVATIAPPGRDGVDGRRLLAVLDETKLRRVLARMLDESEFLSPYGIRSLSRKHLEAPYVFRVGDHEYRVAYEPAESCSGMFGGNSNWRGPIWLPVNALLIRALRQLHAFYGDEFRIECPTGSGRLMNLFEASHEIARRLVRIFVPDAAGRRPVHGGAEKFQRDPHWRDLVLFYEYFHGDDGAGIGASHQTGWTGLVAALIHLYGGSFGTSARSRDAREPALASQA